MSQVNEVETSGGPSSVQSAKRRRGRPRKDSVQANILPADVAPSSEGVHQTARPECVVVGQAVTGVIEATFDSGYLLNVKIGDSDTTLRGVVFKTGHYVPVTAANDVAPHVQMVKRNDVPFNVDNPAVRQTSALVPSKRKYAPRKTAASSPAVRPPVGEGSSVGPVGAEASEDGDKEVVYVVEPLSMVLPSGDQVFVAAKTNPSHRVAEQEVDHGLSNEGTEVGQEDKPKTMIDNSGNSKTSDMEVEVEVEVEEVVKPLAKDSGIVCGPVVDESPLAEPLVDQGSGRMTELLQETATETEVQGDEAPTPSAQVDSVDAVMKESCQENKANEV
ncbi:hypothetical protein ACP275_13G097000 [Erythranthe tilingii]